MRHVLACLLSCTLTTAALLAPTTALAAPDEDEESLPDGCLKSWFCYKPPAADATHPELEENKLKVYLSSLFLGFPFIQWVVSDDSKVAYTDEDLLDQVKAAWLPLLFIIPMYAVCYAMILTIILLPLGYVGLLVTGATVGAWYLYFAPITRIQLVNRTLMREGGRARHKKPGKPLPDEED